MTDGELVSCNTLAVSLDHALRVVISDTTNDGPLSLQRLKDILHLPGVDLCFVGDDEELSVVALAVQVGRPDMVKALLNHCPDAVNVACKSSGITPAHAVQGQCGKECGHWNCVPEMNAVLYACGANPYAKDSWGRPPTLCERGRHGVAEALRDAAQLGPCSKPPHLWYRGDSA